MAVRGPRQQVGLVEPAGAGGDDVGHRDLAGVPVGAADGHGGADARGERSSAVLDDPGVDVVAAADDEVLGPAGEVDEAAGVDAAEVAGVQPAVTDDAVPAHPGAAESGVGDVPGEHGGPADHQHAGLAGGAVGPRPVADPDGFDLLAGQGAADRPGPFLARPGPGAGAGRLGEPVALQQVPPGVRGEGLAHRGRQRGRAHDRQPQRADVGVDRDLRQGGVDGGDGGHRRDLVVLDDLSRTGRTGPCRGSRPGPATPPGRR